MPKKLNWTKKILLVKWLIIKLLLIKWLKPSINYDPMWRLRGHTTKPVASKFLWCHRWLFFSPSSLDHCQFFFLLTFLSCLGLNVTLANAQYKGDLCICFARGNQFNTTGVCELNASWLWVSGPKVHSVSLKCECLCTIVRVESLVLQHAEGHF